MTTLVDENGAIELVSLTKQFGHTTAVNDLSLRVDRGSTFGLIGPNGAGKTTTMKMLMGILRPTTGAVTVLGTDVFAEPLVVKQRVGYVPESHHIDRWMRVGEAVGFCRSLYQSWNNQTCQQLLDLFELDPNKKVKQLSKGMQVKLSLVLAVAHEPEVLLLDEPMAGLDPLAREEFLDGVLRTICERGQTVIFSTHSLDDVQRLADTVGILYGGRLLVHRNIEELLATTKRIRATLTGGSSSRPIARENNLATRAGTGVVGYGGRLHRRESSADSSSRRCGPRRGHRPRSGGFIQGFCQGTKGYVMKWLIWREYRLNRLILITGVQYCCFCHT